MDLHTGAKNSNIKVTGPLHTIYIVHFKKGFKKVLGQIKKSHAFKNDRCR